MTVLRTAFTVIWIVFWIYWLVSAAGAKQGTRTWRSRPVTLPAIILAFLLVRAFKIGNLAVESPTLEVVGSVLFLSGLGLAVWARLYLGRNWGMPMTQKNEPELVTSGPYRYVRHPIYSGLLLAVLGTGLAVELYFLVAFAVLTIYFIYSATVEEKLLVTSFPSTYPSYKTKTKMLIPFVL
jgi:protein-S-isoprenylcysteine O-methyltransferase Ste14